MRKTKSKLVGSMVLTITIVYLGASIVQGSAERKITGRDNMWLYFANKLIIVAPPVDGYSWRKMTQREKLGHLVGYARGFEEGVISAWAHAMGEGSLENWYEWPFIAVFKMIDSYGELVEAVDEFYSDYANRRVCLSFALPIIINRMKGYISDKEAREMTQKARSDSRRIRKYKEGIAPR